MTRTAHTLTVTTSDPETHTSTLRQLITTLDNTVVTLALRGTPGAEITCTLLNQDWLTHPEELHAAAFIEPGQPEPSIGLHHVQLANIGAIHIW
ncbi:MAG: hypothetical protein AB7N61_23480 [Acidimicrobiia bacterium]